jgi:hypothetical protein
MLYRNKYDCSVMLIIDAALIAAGRGRRHFVTNSTCALNENLHKGAVEIISENKKVRLIGTLRKPFE